MIDTLISNETKLRENLKALLGMLMKKIIVKDSSDEEVGKEWRQDKKYHLPYGRSNQWVDVIV